MSEADQSVYSYLRSLQQSPLTAGVAATHFFSMLLFGASYTIALWPFAVSGVQALFGKTPEVLVGGLSFMLNIAFLENFAMVCVGMSVAALPTGLYSFIWHGRFGARLVGLAFAVVSACLFEVEGSVWAKPRVALLRSIPELNKLNKLVPVFMPIFAIAYLGILSSIMFPLLAVQIVIKLHALIRSKRRLTFRLRRLRRPSAQSNLEQLVKRLTPQVWEYSLLQRQHPFAGPAIRNDGPPTSLVIEDERDSQLFSLLLKDGAEKWAKIAWPGAGSKTAALPFCTQLPFRLGLWRYIFNNPKFQPDLGEELDLNNQRRPLLLDHLDIAFVPPMASPLTATRHRDMVNDVVFGHVLLFFQHNRDMAFLSVATLSSILRGLEAVAFPSLGLTFPEMYSKQGLLLHDPVTIARDYLGLRYPPFDPKKDRIPSDSEILANPDLQAFFTSFSSLLTLVKRLNISDENFLQHWDAAFDEARKEIDLGLMEHEVGELILEAVLAWKDVKREKEEKEEEAKKKQD